MKELRNNNMALHSRGNGFIVWSIIFMALSVVMPGIATVISLIISLGLRKYPKRKAIEISLIVISIVITIVLFMTGFITEYWSSFFAGASAGLKQ